MIRRVAYPKSEWSRGEAWAHLHAQMIPGCPKRLLVLDEFGRVETGPEFAGDREVWAHGWRKCHTADEWAWSYRPPQTSSERYVELYMSEPFEVEP